MHHHTGLRARGTLGTRVTLSFVPVLPGNEWAQSFLSAWVEEPSTPETLSAVNYLTESSPHLQAPPTHCREHRSHS